MKSGVYAARLKAGDGEDYVPFFVRPKRGTSSSKIAFLAPTLSYYAYANEHMMLNPKNRGIMDLPPDYQYPVQPGDKYVVQEGLNSLYDVHTDGSGVCYSTRLRPWVTMRPKYTMTQFVRGKGSPHQFNADLHLIDWLEAKGFEYDVISDEDLHHEGTGLLKPYRVIVGGTHHEYWSEQMLDAIEAYLDQGGRFMNLAGNGYYWVTSIDPVQPHIVEIRRWGGTETWEAAPGEYYLSTTGEMGGLWRNRNRAPNKWVGAGFTAEGFDRGSPYRRQPDSFDPRAAFIFEGIGKDELIGDFTNLVMEHGAAGFEIDRADHLLGTPSHTLVLATATDYTDNYQFVIEEVNCADSKQSASVNPGVRGDIVFLEFPNGGGVFSASSISWCGCLHYNNYDNNVSRITENVLRRFASDKPLSPSSQPS
jgi:N,N-dimethylformamidase beta subunit-like protein